MTHIYISVALQMSQNGGGCDRGLWTAISRDYKPWPKCSHSNHVKWWTDRNDRSSEKNQIKTQLKNQMNTLHEKLKLKNITEGEE